jgi:hypothetical protein
MSTTNATPSLVSKVVKLSGTTRYNGEIGLCVGFNQERNRYSVKLDAATVIAVKSENLLLANTVDKVKYRVREAKWQSQQIVNDPNVRRQAHQAYMTVASMLPSYLPPERLAVVLLILSVLIIRTIGLFKSLILFSLLMLPVSVSLKDIMQNPSIIRNPKHLIRRFPTNLKNALAEATGYTGISETMAVAGTALFVGMAVKVLLAPAVENSVPNQRPLGPDVQDQLREIYKLGFEDGARGKDYGTSFGHTTLEDYVSMIGTSFTGKPVENFDWSNTSPPAAIQKPSIWRKMNFGTIMTLATIVGVLLKPRQRV